MIPWILMIGIVALFALWLFRPFAIPWLRTPAGSTPQTDNGTADMRDSDGPARSARRGTSLPAANRVLDRTRRDRLAPLDADVANAAADEDANAVAAMVSQGVVDYERARRRQETGQGQAPAP
jgi:hypothetical protein